MGIILYSGEHAAHSLEIVLDLEIYVPVRSAELVGPDAVDGAGHLDDLVLVLGLGGLGVFLEVGPPLGRRDDEVGFAERAGFLVGVLPGGVRLSLAGSRGIGKNASNGEQYERSNLHGRTSWNETGEKGDIVDYRRLTSEVGSPDDQLHRQRVDVGFRLLDDHHQLMKI